MIGPTLLARARRPGGPARAWLGLVLALALALKLLVPQGWMPGPGGRLILCPSAGPTTAMTGMHHGGDKAPAHGADHPCAFAGLGLAAAPPPPLAAIVAPATHVPPALAPARAVTVGRGLAAPPPPATGPPRLA